MIKNNMLVISTNSNIDWENFGRVLITFLKNLSTKCCRLEQSSVVNTNEDTDSNSNIKNNLSARVNMNHWIDSNN